MTTIHRVGRTTLVPPAPVAVTLELSEVRADDLLLIYTRNSFYSFRVTDADAMRGQLAGGAQLGSGADAILLGVISRPHGSRHLNERARLKTNSRARFLVAVGGEAREMLTSAITRLVCLRSDGEG